MKDLLPRSRGLLLGSMLAFTPGLLFAQAKTLGVSEVKVTTALVKSADRSGKRLEMDRVVQALDSQLIDRVNATRKFKVLGRSDLKSVLKEQELGESGNVDAKSAAKQFKLTGADYLLVPTVDDFQDYMETAKFEGTGRSAQKRLIRFSCVGKIYDATKGELLESANFQISNKDISELRDYSVKDGNLSDELLVAIAREMAERMATRVADVVFPAKVVNKLGKQLTINRGDGSGVEVGQLWNVFAVGKELIDPDTKESLGRQELLVGKAKITQVNPRVSLAEVVEDTGIEEGAILRKPQQ